MCSFGNPDGFHIIIDLNQQTQQQTFQLNAEEGEYKVVIHQSCSWLNNSQNHCRCRLLISEHQEVERKILAELDALNLLASQENPNPRSMHLGDLNSMPFFLNVCKVGCWYPCASNASCTAQIGRHQEVSAGQITLQVHKKASHRLSK